MKQTTYTHPTRLVTVTTWEAGYQESDRTLAYDLTPRRHVDNLALAAQLALTGDYTRVQVYSGEHYIFVSTRRES